MMPFFLYVTLSVENRVASFAADPETGKLKPIAQISVPDRPSQLAVDPLKRFLYVGREGGDFYRVSTFAIDRVNGSLKLINEASFNGGGNYIATDRTGGFLLSADYFNGRVAVHEIETNGGVGRPVQWLTTSPGAHSIQTDPSNRYAFVPHVAEVVQLGIKGLKPGPNMILQFQFDTATGTLTPNVSKKVTAAQGAGPRHFCFHPTLDIVYFSNEQGGSVTAYRFSTTKGTLTPFQTVPTFPHDFVGRNMCSDIQISTSGKFLYVPNRGHNSIACFSVDESNGELSGNGWVPTGSGTRTLAFSPDGKFLFAACEHADCIASYGIHQKTGTLKPIESYPGGKGPMWVLAVPAQE